METNLDAVALVRGIRDRQHDQLEGRTWDERVAFFREHADRLHEQLEWEQREQPARSESPA